MALKTFENPLETVFNIAPGSTKTNELAEYEDDNMIAVPASEVSQSYQDDLEDADINEKIEKIYEVAMETFENQTAMMEIVEPRYAARNSEVAAQYLNIALNATSLKAKTKNEKRKSSTFIPFGNNTNISGNNIVVADRNQILDMLRNKEKNEG